MSTGVPPTEVDRTEVRVLPAPFLDAAVEVLARGFAEEPSNVALFPDAELRQSIWKLAARNALEEPIRLGTAHAALVDDVIAALAVWEPPGTRSAGVAARTRSLTNALAQAPTIARGLPHAARVVLPQAPQGLRMQPARKAVVKRVTDGPTWHLGFLTTVPEHRGRGLARLLLERQLARCDEDELPTWLETTDPVNPPIYERFGFQTVLHLTDAAWLPGFWLMRREPRTARSA